MLKVAHVQNNVVTNISLWDGKSQWMPNEDNTIYVNLNENETCEMGFLYSENSIPRFIFQNNTVKTWTPLEFLSRFTDAEMENIESLRVTDAGVRTFYRMASFAQEIVSNDPRTTQGLDYLVFVGVLTEQRKEQILSS